MNQFGACVFALVALCASFGAGLSIHLPEVSTLAMEGISSNDSDPETLAKLSSVLLPPTPHVTAKANFSAAVVPVAVGPSPMPRARPLPEMTLKYGFWNEPVRSERLKEIEQLEQKEERKELVGKFRPVSSISREEVADKITIAIKTFERASCVVRMVHSIRRFYPTINIIVADDSREWAHAAQELSELDRLTYIPLPFDAGAGAGKNILIDSVHTPYVMVMDDDLLFSEHSVLEYLLADMESSGSDVTGGCIDDLTNESDCAGDFDMFHKDKMLNSDAYSTLEFRANEHRFMDLAVQRDGQVNYTYTPFCKESDFVTNSFLARTAFLSKVRWDPFFKVGGEEDMFYRAKKDTHAYVRFCTSFKTIHRHSSCAADQHAQSRYERFRGRRNSFLEYFFAKHPPVTKLELPNAHVLWRCDCNEVGSTRTDAECSRPMSERTDCKATWFSAQYNQISNSDLSLPQVHSADDGVVKDGLVYVRASSSSAMPSP